tara:strand:- start:480 stop:833 length:354 start_codon:yes stop_codon:yes gene_type:complete
MKLKLTKERIKNIIKEEVGRIKEAGFTYHAAKEGQVDSTSRFVASAILDAIEAKGTTLSEEDRYEYNEDIVGRLTKDTEFLEFIGGIVDEIERYHSDSGGAGDDAPLDIEPPHAFDE